MIPKPKCTKVYIVKKKKKKKNVSPMPKPLKLGSPLLGGNYRFFIYISRGLLLSFSFTVTFFPMGTLLETFYLVFATVSSLSFRSLFTDDKVDLPWGPSSKCQLLVDGFWFYPVSNSSFCSG